MSEIISNERDQDQESRNTIGQEKVCFICFEDLAKIESESEAEPPDILTMSDCGCREYVHPKCIGQWIETHYDYIPNSNIQIRCPICNTHGTLESPQPIFTRSLATLTIQRFFVRFQRNQTQHFNQLLLLNPLNPRHQAPFLAQQGQVDMKRFLAVTCAMFSIIFVLLWILFIFDLSPK